MAELESLSSVEVLDEHIRRHNLDRLIMLSDGIFAIAVTLAALQIKVPAHMDSTTELAAQVFRPVFAYQISFVLSAVFWFHSRNLFARIVRVDTVFTALTLATLCVVALIPVAAYAVYAPGVRTGAFRFYAYVMGSCGLLNCAMWAYATAKPGMMRPEVPWLYRWQRIVQTGMIPLLFVPVAVLPIDRSQLVVLPLLVGFAIVRRVVLPRLVDRARPAATE